MGKRELVLIALFLVVGIAVYQFTAPPAPPGSDLSVGGIFQRMRRGMQGPRETASANSQQTFPVAPGVQKLRLNLLRPCDLTVTGSDRSDIAVEIRVVARGFEQAEVRAAADGAGLTLDPTKGDTMIITNAWNDRRIGQQAFVTQVAITLRVPQRLQLTVLPHIGLLAVKDVASLDAASSRGDTHVSAIAGDVRLSHVGGTLEVAGATSLKVTTRNSRGEISAITGTVSVDTSGSRLTLTDIGGPLEVESRTTDLTIRAIDALKAPLRYNGTNGQLRIEGLRSEARLDGHNTDMDVRLATAAPVTIYNLGAISVTAPPDGYTLDAVATEGRITTDDSSITATPSDGPDARVNVKVRGGGPTLTLRATRGRIEVRGAGK
jgi:hypothetical protein